MEPVIAYFDGLCEPTNPRGSACGGWFVEPHPAIPEGTAGGRFYLAGEGATNNVAEYNAALDCLRAIYKAGYRGAVLLHGDSQLVVKQFTGEYACNAEHLRPLLAKLRHAVTFFESVQMIWVRRELNEKADEQSRQAYYRVGGREVAHGRR